MDYSPPGSFVHGILQARILEWLAISFSKGSSQPRDWTCVSHISCRCFTIWATGMQRYMGLGILWFHKRVSQVALVVKICLAMQETQETQVWSLGWEDPLEESLATHSSILAWKIPWTEEPDGLQSVGSQQTGYNWTHIHTKTCIIKKKGVLVLFQM